MSKKEWISIWFYIIMIIPIIGIFNYLVDPYGMNNFLKINKLNYYKKGNASFTFRVKTNIVINNDFDTLMLGTSRIGVMDPTVVEKDLRGRAFNFSVPASTTEIQHKIFLYTLKYNKIKSLVYGIDFMSFNENRSIKKDFKSFDELSDKIDKKKKIYNYDFYFNLDTFYDSLTVLYQNIMEKKVIEISYSSENGMREHNNHIDALRHGTFDLDKKLNKSIKDYFGVKKGIYKNYKFSKKYLEYFKKTINYCNKNNIEVWVYIPPMQNKHLQELKRQGYFERFEEFKKELVEVTDYIDFTSSNQFTKNKNNYWDTSHLRKEFTAIIMNNVFHNNSLTEMQRIGILVNKDNIESHLKNVRNSLLNTTRARKED